MQDNIYEMFWILRKKDRFIFKVNIIIIITLKDENN